MSRLATTRTQLAALPTLFASVHAAQPRAPPPVDYRGVMVGANGCALGKSHKWLFLKVLLSFLSFSNEWKIFTSVTSMLQITQEM